MCRVESEFRGYDNAFNVNDHIRANNHARHVVENPPDSLTITRELR